MYVLHCWHHAMTTTGQLMMGTLSGLTLKFKYMQMNQTYVTNINMSDDIVPEIASLGLIVPLIGYYASQAQQLP